MEKKIHQLEHLLKDAQNPKILWEEMQLISEKAFALQDKIMAELEAAEQEATDVEEIQGVFDLREGVWDIMKELATRELAVKEKTHHPKQKEACCHEKTGERSCCCGHEKTDKKTCCCGGDHHHKGGTACPKK